MRGSRITPRQVETIKAVYAETASITRAAEAAGVPRKTAAGYVNGDGEDEFAALRREKRADIIEEIARVRLAAVERMGRPEVLDKTDFRDLAVGVGILTDKHQLLTGEATSRTETRHADEDARLDVLMATYPRRNGIATPGNDPAADQGQPGGPGRDGH